MDTFLTQRKFSKDSNLHTMMKKINGRSLKGKAKQQTLQSHIAAATPTRGSEGWLASEIRGNRGRSHLVDGVGGPVTGPLVFEIPRVNRVSQKSRGVI